MSLIHDLDRIVATVLPADPSFQGIARRDIDTRLDQTRQHASASAQDEFLLSMMRLLALPRNGHTRLIPNTAISIFPLRFMTIGRTARLRDAAPGFARGIGGELISINGVPIGKIEVAAKGFLAGTSQRKRVIGPILFAWPGALRRLGFHSGGDPIVYRLSDNMGQISALILDLADRVPGTAFYPRNEHGKAGSSWSPKSFLEIRDFGDSGLLLVLPSFLDAGETELSDAISQAAHHVRSCPSTPILVDVRGNTGGNFIRTKPLIDAISEGAEDRQVGLIIDKFTFSAAIVFVAILKHRLGARLHLIGEEMGDGLKFFAEGGTIDLSSSGAVVRYATAFHDWAGGRVDDTTARAIATEIVAAGPLEPDRAWIAHSDDAGTLDRFYREVLDSLAIQVDAPTVPPTCPSDLSRPSPGGGEPPTPPCSSGFRA